MSMKKLLQSKRRGSTIALVVIAILILLAVGVGMLGLGVIDNCAFDLRCDVAGEVYPADSHDAL